MNSNLKHSLVGALAILCSVHASAANYKLIPLGLTGPSTDATVTGLSGKGLVVGSIHDLRYPRRNAILWTDGTPENLGEIGGRAQNQSFATAINNHGDVVGVSASAAVVWKGSDVVEIWMGAAAAINDKGTVAGSIQEGSVSKAALWIDNKIVSLATLGGTNGAATAVNAYDVAVGSSQPIGDPIAFYGTGGVGFLSSRASLWDKDGVHDLGTLGGDISWAAAINDREQIVGTSYTTLNTVRRATIWEDRLAYELPDSSLNDSFALAINNNGKIVGQSSGQAVVWESSSSLAVKLITLLEPEVANAWTLFSATGINDSGVIVGNGFNFVSGQYQGFLLSPIPEPNTWALMLAGIALLQLAQRTNITRRPNAT